MIRPAAPSPGPHRRELSEVWAAIQRVQIVSSPTIQVGRQSDRGTLLDALPPTFPASPFVVCQVTEEGPDALRATILGVTTEVIIAKPFHLQKNVWDAAVGGSHAEHQNDVTVVSIAREEYSGGIYGQPEWVLTLNHTNNKNSRPDAVEVLVIHPSYPPQCFVPTLIALRMPIGVMKVDPITLAFDPAGEEVFLLDANLEARRWTKRTAAEYAEPVTGVLDEDGNPVLNVLVRDA